MRFGVVGGGFTYRADLLAWSGRPVRTTSATDLQIYTCYRRNLPCLRLDVSLPGDTLPATLEYLETVAVLGNAVVPFCPGDDRFGSVLRHSDTISSNTRIFLQHHLSKSSVSFVEFRPSSTMTSLSTLERAAADVISILKGIDEFSNARIAVIGGMALRKYLPNGRTTDVL